MNDTMTAPNIIIAQDELIAASGPWRFVPGSSPHGWRISQSPLRAAALTVFFAVSPLTAAPDPWFIDRKRQVPTTLGSAFQPIIGRRVTILEARNIALAVLARAEKERLQMADQEARRGIDWEQQA